MGIESTTVVSAPVDEVFAWHERPGAIRRLMPPWQPITVRAEADNLRDGRAELRLPGGLVWVAQHGGYVRGEQFYDELTSLPLRWRHSHEFHSSPYGTDDETVVVDRVDTPVPAALLRSTFAYRGRQLTDDMAVHLRTSARGEPMTIAVTGASGLIGTALCAQLTTSGHTVIRLVRRPANGPDERQWDPQMPAGSLLDGVDAVVHLAGESIAGRFNDEHRRKVYNSRVEPTRLLAGLAARSPGVKTFVCASGIGIYGADRGDEILTEQSEPGDGFLAQVVLDWEDATEAAASGGVRVVNVRTGIVQSPRGGVLKMLRPLFVSGLGGRLGDGKQWTSWIDLDDLTDIYLEALTDPSLSGPLNAVAPNPVRNAEYSRELGKALRRPALLPVPSFGPKLLLGREGAEETAFSSQRVSPAVLLERQHQFRRATIRECLRHQLGRFDREPAAPVR